MNTSCIYAPEGNQKKVANILSGNTETGNLTEQDKATLAQFNDWWQRGGSNKFPLEEGVDIFGDEVLEAHPEIVEAFNSRERFSKIDGEFLATKRAQTRSLILDFPTFDKRKEAYETVAFYINAAVAMIMKDTTSEVQKPSLFSIKDKVKELIANDTKALQQILSKTTDPKTVKKITEALEKRPLLSKDIDALYPSAVAIYKMYYADITQVARINDSNITLDDEENNDTSKDSTQEDFSHKDHFEDTFGKIGIESFANSLVKQIATQMVFKDAEGKDKTNSFGVPEKVPSARVFGQLCSWLVNIKSQDDMMARLQEKSQSPDGYWLKSLMSLIKSSPKAADIKNALFVTFNKANVNYAIHTLYSSGKVGLKNFLKTDSEVVLNDAWRFQVLETIGFDTKEKEDTIYNEDKKTASHILREARRKLTDLLKDYSKPVDENKEEYIAALKGLFDAVGIHLPNDVLNMIVSYKPTEEDYPLGENEDDNRKKLLDALNSIFGRISKYVLDANINSKEPIDFSNMRQYVEELSKEVGSKMLVEVQRSTKIGKDVMYNTVNNSYILTQKKFLFEGKTTKEIAENWINPYYLNDPWYNREVKKDGTASVFKPYLPILEDLANGRGKEYTRVIDRKNQNDKEYSRMTRDDILYAEWTAFLSEYSSAKEKALHTFWGYFKDGIFGDSSKFMFMRMPVYTKEKVLSHLADIVFQEYNRILRVEDKLKRRENGEHVRITEAEVKSGVKFNFFPELNRGGFFKTGIERFAGIEPKGDVKEKINFKQALDILSVNPTAMQEFIKHYLYNTDKGYPEGIVADIIKQDRQEILNFNHKETRVTCVGIVKAYNDKYDGSKTFFGPYEYRDVIPVSTIKEIKKKASERMNTLKAAKKEGKLDEKADYEIDMLRRIVNAATFDIEVNLYDNVDRFLFNRLLHSIQLLELRDKDLAYFKSSDDYIKRSKQSTGDYVSPNVDAPTKQHKVAEKVLVIKDPMTRTDDETLGYINKVIDKAVSEGKMSKRQGSYLKKTWAKPITSTDGQMMRTLISKRDLDIMLALPESTGIVSKIYDTIINDENPSPEEMANISRMISVMKEFSYSMPAANGNAPTQLKNGTVTLNHNSKNSGILANNPKLKAIQRFAEENGYDAIVFTSGMKVGKPIEEDVIDLDAVNFEGMSNGEIEAALYNSIKEQAEAKPLATIDGIEFKFLGEQTKERNFDMENASMSIGTQLTKIVPSSIKNSKSVHIAGRNITGQQGFILYQAAAVLEKISDWNGAKKVFANKHSLNKKLRGGIESSKKFNSELIEGLETDKEGNPLIPYNDITISGVFEDKLLAFGRKSLSKLIASSLGDHLYTTSAYGFEGDAKPRVVYDKKSGNLAYVECYAPLIYKELLKDCLVKDNNGETFSLNTKRLARKYKDNPKLYERIMGLFNIVGYRVPTEGICSIIPIKIKGFLPLSNQASIILPDEMITRLGMDMDGDEIFILKKAVSYYNKDMYIRDNDLVNASEEEQEAAWEKVKDELNGTPVVTRYKISDTLLKAIEEGDYEQVFKEMSVMNEKQLHNMLVDLIFASTINEEGTIDGIRVSSFEEINRTSKLIKYINLLDLNKDNIKKAIAASEKWLDEDSDTLGEKVQSLSKTSNPMSLKASLDATEETLAGKKFLGIFAVGKAVGAITLTTDSTIDGPYIAGKQLKSLSIANHSNAENPMSNIAQAVAACPDNSKDPTITAFGVNDVTKNVIQILVQGGFDLQTIGLLMNQPIVKAIAKRVMSKGDSENPSVGDIESALVSLKEKFGNVEISKELKEKILNGETINTSTEELLKNILLNKANMMSSSDKISQYYIGVLFTELYRLGSIYSNRSRCLRGDSNSGALGTSIEESLKRIQTVDSYVAETQGEEFPITENFPITSADYTPSKTESDSAIFKELMSSSFPLSYAQYALGVKGFLGLMSDFYPQLYAGWKKAIFKTRNFSKNNFKINDLYTFLWHKELQKDPSKDKAELMVDIIIKSPRKLQQLKDNSKYADNPFIKDLNFKYRKIGGTDVSIPVIESSTTLSQGRVSNDKIKNVIDGWKQLNEDDNSKIASFAREMLLYFMYVYGNTWKPGSLVSVRPNNVVLSIANYRESLDIIRKAPSEAMANNYDEQSTMNHLDIMARKMSDATLEEFKIDRETATVKEVKAFFNDNIKTASGPSVYVKIPVSDGVVYLKNDNGVYKVIEPLNVTLEGLSIINMDSTKELKDLPNLKQMLLDRAKEAKVTSKATREMEEDFLLAQDSDINAAEQENPEKDYYEGAFESLTEEDFVDKETIRDASFPVKELKENKNEAGEIEDKTGIKKCNE